VVDDRISNIENYNIQEGKIWQNTFISLARVMPQ